MGAPVRPVTPGLTPPGSMISPPSGALNILVSINRNRMEATCVQDQLFTTPGRGSCRAGNGSARREARVPKIVKTIEGSTASSSSGPIGDFGK